MRKLWVVCRKEILDNVRDRRTMFSALFFGPLFGPLLFAVMIHIIVDRATASSERTLAIPLIGIESAPNLRAFLSSQSIDSIDNHGLENIDDAAAAVRAAEHSVVVVLDPDFAEHFSTADAARVTLVFDRSRSSGNPSIQRVQAALRAYSEQIGALRLLARGLSPSVTRPLLIDQRDVSTPAGRSALLLGVLTYFLLFATLMGGMYLAIDTTAGERERRSLEPLLTLPVKRETILAGKVAATAMFMLLSLGLTLIGFSIALKFMPLDRLGMSSGFNITGAAYALIILVPFAFLGAVLMTLVASFTRSYKEAQTYLGLLLIVPTLPVAVATVLDIEMSQALMWVPSMSQHLLITALIKQEPITLLAALQSMVSTAIYARLLWALTAKAYKRETLLG